MVLEEIKYCLPGLYNMRNIPTHDGDSMNDVCIIVIQDEAILIFYQNLQDIRLFGLIMT